MTPSWPKLHNKLKAKTTECVQRRKKLDAAATMIAALHHDNQVLCEHLDSGHGGLTNLNVRSAESPGGAADGPVEAGGRGAHVRRLG